MSFTAPLWLAAAGLVAAGVLVAHLFRTTVPPQDLLPTVQFVPESAPLTVLRSRRLSDLWLLLLRLLAVALLGLALAGAHMRREPPARVVLIDVSRAVGAMPVALDSADALADAAALIAFDSIPRRIPRDSLRGLVASGARGSLSAAIVAAHRILAAAGGDRDVPELVLVSPLVREEVDSATARLLDLWQGTVRVVRVPAAMPTGAGGWEVRADGDDPVAAAIPGNPSQSPASVRVVRTRPTRADSVWAEGGGALVLWPTSDQPDARRAVADSQGGVTDARHVAIAPFVREHEPPSGRVIARWTDGAAAATERPLGKGCVRHVTVPVDAVGDLALRESFRGIVRSFLEACGGTRDLSPAELSALLPSGRSGPNVARRTANAAIGTDSSSSLPLWLASIALAVLIAEQVLRARVKPRAAA